MDCSMPGFPVLHHLPEFAQTHVHWVGDAIQPSHPLSSPSSPAFCLSQHQGLYQWVSSAHQVAKYWSFSISPSNEYPGMCNMKGLKLLMKVKVAKSCLCLCDPMDCSPPGSSVHIILQARRLEWVAIPFSGGSSWPRDWTQVSNPGLLHCRQSLYHLRHEEGPKLLINRLKNKSKISRIWRPRHVSKHINKIKYRKKTIWRINWSSIYILLCLIDSLPPL